MSKIKINIGDRWAILGATGSGKTTLTKHLLSTLAYATQGKIPIYILDSKISGDFQEFTRKGIGVLHTGNKLPPIHDVKYGAFQVWQPEEDDKELYDEYFKQIYKNREPCIIYIDELGSLTNAKGTVFPRYYDILLKQGRGLHIGLISTTQSPSYVPANLLRQTTHLVRMRLNSEYDVKKLVGTMGKEAEEEPKDQFGFYYRDCTKPKSSNPTLYYKDLTEFF